MSKIKQLLDDKDVKENPYDDSDPLEDLEEARQLAELDSVIKHRLLEDFQFYIADKDNKNGL